MPETVRGRKAAVIWDTLPAVPIWAGTSRTSGVARHSRMMRVDS